MTWELSIAGLLIGALVGLTGMGGGSLMTPLLVLVFGFSPTTAIGTDILHGAVFKTVGAVRHRMLGTVHVRLGGWMFLASAPMSLVGVAIATWLGKKSGDSADSLIGALLGAALLAGGIGLAAKSFVRHEERPDATFVLESRHRRAAIVIGSIGGLIVGLTSVGTGVFFGLTMLVLFPLRAARVVGTDIFHAAALLWVAGVGHLVAGNVALGAMGWLLAGSVPGVLVGSQFTLRLPENVLRIALATIIAASGVKLLDGPHADAFVVTLVCVGSFMLVLEMRRGRASADLALPQASEFNGLAPRSATPVDASGDAHQHNSLAARRCYARGSRVES